METMNCSDNKTQVAAQQCAAIMESLLPSIFVANIEDLKDGCLKLEIASERESATTVAAILCGLAGVFLFLQLKYQILGIILFLIAPVLVGLRISIDDYLIISLADKMIYYRRRLFFNEKLVPFLAFRDITSLTVKSRKQRNKYRCWEENRAVAVNRSGKTFALTDFKESDYYDMADFTQSLARGLGLEYTAH